MNQDLLIGAAVGLLAGYTGGWVDDGISRFIVEFFREPDEQLGLYFSLFSMGQFLCVPMILVGLCLIWRARAVQ